MTIEFHTQRACVTEELLDYIRNEVMKMSHLSKKISRAEVVVKEDKTITSSENKICEIRLTIYGDDLLAHSRSSDFRKSAREVIKELKELVKQLMETLHEPPDITTSTVQVR